MSYLGSSSTLYDPTRNSPKTAQVFSGDGVTTVFTLQYSVAQSTDIEVIVENVIQQPDYAYTATGNLLTFTGTPRPGTNNIYVNYNRTAGLTGTVPDGSISSSKLATNIRLLATDQYTGNGSATQFALSDTPADANSLVVTVNGVTQAAPTNYTTSGNIITFTSAPLAGANVVIRNLGFRTTSTLYALSAGTPIVQPQITGGTINLASSVSTTNGFNVYDSTGTQLKAGINANNVFSTGNLVLQAVNSIQLQSGSNTITLPASTGTVLTTGSPQSGGVIQVVQGSTTTQTTSSSTSYVAASGVTATITPKFSTSKILVLVSSTISSGGGGQYIYTAIAKNGTVTFEGSASYAVGSGTNIWCPCIMSYLDSPATTSATTYAMYFRQANGGLSGSVQVGWSSPITSTVTLMEIAA